MIVFLQFCKRNCALCGDNRLQGVLFTSPKKLKLPKNIPIDYRPYLDIPHCIRHHTFCPDAT